MTEALRRTAHDNPDVVAVRSPDDSVSLQLMAVNIGAAPTPVEVLEFIHALGIEVAELLGMSETCGLGACNRPGEIKIGTVGPAAPVAELRLADDGELLVRGEFVMRGYRDAPLQTAEAIDPEGWLHTGDLGEIDADAYLTIVDRKKELISDRARCRLRAAVGDGGGAGGQIASGPCQEPRVIAAVQAGVDEANARLSRVEQIKRFTIVAGDWTHGGDELTPTMKLKRKPISAKYGPRSRRCTEARSPTGRAPGFTSAVSRS